jgi:3-methyladenine DNA glycosylase AlkD
MPEVDIVINELKKHSNPKNREGMARFGIETKTAFGVSIPDLRKIATQHENGHELALELWKTNIHEARILASYIADPEKVDEKLMEEWVKDFDSWDLCDQCCSSLFDRTKFAWKKAVEWTERDEEFVKRAGFVLMAALSVHDKETGDKEFLKFLPIIEREVNDDRNFVKKAVNWALRQIGKRSLYLNKEAIKAGEKIKKMDSKSARWIASNALNELKSEAIQKRLREK